MQIHIKNTLMLLAVIAISACGKSGPLDVAADQIAKSTLKTTYANASERARLEEQAEKDWGMDAEQLIKTCSVSVLQYMKLTPDLANKIAAEITNPASSDAISRDLTPGFKNHLERCLTKPSAYDIVKE